MHRGSFPAASAAALLALRISCAARSMLRMASRANLTTANIIRDRGFDGERAWAEPAANMNRNGYGISPRGGAPCTGVVWDNA